MNKCIILILSFLSTTVCADKLPDIETPDLSIVSKAINDFKSNPNSYIKDYTESPKEVGFLDKDIDKVGRDSAKTNDDCQEIIKSSELTAGVNLGGGDLSKSLFIMNNADAISRGISNKYVDCNNTNKCEATWDYNKTCSESPLLGDITCTSATNQTCNSVKPYINAGLCASKPIKTRCLSGTDTCHMYEQTYSCPQTGTCSTLREESCEEMSSNCISRSNGLCTKYEKKYKCPVKKCAQNSNITCGESSLCLDGSCDKHPIDSSKDQQSGYKRVIEDMGVLGEIVKSAPDNFNDNSRFIFSAKAQTCTKKRYHMNDCCKNKGWLKNFMHCSSGEKELQKAGKNGLTIFIGDYHKGKHHRKKKVYVYCRFPSKLARIVQVAGKKQLHRGFGSPKGPDCAGFSPNELSRIDFDKIDFSEITHDMEDKIKIPNPGKSIEDGKNAADDLSDNNQRSKRVD